MINLTLIMKEVQINFMVEVEALEVEYVITVKKPGTQKTTATPRYVLNVVNTAMNQMTAHGTATEVEALV